MNRTYIYIFVIWLFTISGIIGIATGYEDWFLSLTPLNLAIYLVLILLSIRFDQRTTIALVIPFAIGMIAEYLGVNYGLIFGNYAYGENLGLKIKGVPWMIGVNWAILTYCTAALVKDLKWNLGLKCLVSASLMVLLDLIIEVNAPRFDFWEFEGGIVPLQNYVGWLITAFIAHFIFQNIVKTYQKTVAVHIFTAILVFFSSFLIL